MFNNLGDRFKDIFKKVSGQGKLTENNMKDALREVRLALGKKLLESRLLAELIQHSNSLKL